MTENRKQPADVNPDGAANAGAALRHFPLVNDSTDGRQVKASLIESNKLLQAIIETEPVGVIILASDGTLIMMNRSGLAMLQVDSPEEAKGIVFTERIVPDYREAFRNLTNEVFQGTAGMLTFELEGFKGKRLWLNTHAVPLRNDKDEIIALLGIACDITEKRKIEEDLKKERDFMSAVLDTGGSMILVLDRDGRIVRFNRTCEEVSGYTFEEVRGRYVWDFLIPPEQVEEVKKVFSELTAGMFPNKYENYWVARDGHRKLIAWSNTALLGADGAVEYVIPTGIDITERRKAEEGLLQEKQFSDIVIDSLPGIFYICDEEGKLLRFNNNEKEITGYNNEELTGMNVLRLFREDRDLVKSKMQEVFESGRASVEAKMVTRHGVSIPFMLTGFRMIIHDKRYLVGVGINLSERKRLEDQLLQAQKLESIGTLANGISHDFNNILTAIIGYGSLLQMNMNSDDPMRHHVAQILATANRAASLTQGLLTYSRKQVLNAKLVDLNEIIRKVERLLARLIGENIELKSILVDRDVTILADTGQIEQVLMNLAINARDAMPGGGYLYLETQIIDLDEESAKMHSLAKLGTYALLLVTDSGGGMDQKTRERIFEPFFTTKDMGKGTGLGLAIVYGIITQHKGSIEVDSEVGLGSTFRMYLPIAQQSAEETVETIMPPLQGGTETILVAEDDETVRALIAQALTQFGYTVIQAENGEDAVNKFMASRKQIKLLLLDVLMPKKNGREVFDKVRIFEPDIKALFLTGYAADIMNPNGMPEPGSHFIYKPIPVQELVRTVRAVLDGKE